jgi:hypothetical protein
MSADRLLIVYNAEPGIVAGAKDSLHKLLSPGTYPCSLCALTHGLVRADPAWRRFLDRSPLEVRAYHRSDFRARYPDLDLPLPAILVERGHDAELLIHADELKSLRSVDALIDRIEALLSRAEPTTLPAVRPPPKRSMRTI